MKKELLFDKVVELKEKFRNFFQQRKKITALENFSEAAAFPHKKYLTLIKSCMADGFLEDAEASFLEHMLNRYEVNYLDWSHRTRWLKKEIAERRGSMIPAPSQVFFNFDKLAPNPVNVPLHLIGAQSQTQTKRI